MRRNSSPMENAPKSAPRKYAHVTMTRDAYEKCAKAVLLGFGGEMEAALKSVHDGILAESEGARAYDYEAALQYLVERGVELRAAVAEAIAQATRAAVTRAVRETLPPPAASDVA